MSVTGAMRCPVPLLLGSMLPRCPCRAEKAVLETNLFEAQERLGQLNTCRQQLEAEKQSLRVARDGLLGEQTVLRWGSHHISAWLGVAASLSSSAGILGHAT